MFEVVVVATRSRSSSSSSSSRSDRLTCTVFIRLVWLLGCVVGCECVIFVGFLSFLMFGCDVLTVKQGYPNLTLDDGFRNVKIAKKWWENVKNGWTASKKRAKTNPRFWWPKSPTSAKIGVKLQNVESRSHFLVSIFAISDDRKIQKCQKLMRILQLQNSVFTDSSN